MNMADNSHRSQEGDAPKPTAGTTNHEKPSSALPDIGSSWRSRAASLLAPSISLGYTNITVIKDLYIGSKRKERSDCEGDGSAFHEQESGTSPKTIEELLAISKYDESKKINEVDYHYLLGCLDMLLAVRKDYSLEIALPSRLSEILKVDENSWLNFTRQQAARSSNQPSHTGEGMKDSSHHQYQSANQEKPHEGRNTSPQPQSQSSHKSSTESTAGFQATASVPHTNTNVLAPSVSLSTSQPSRECQQPEQIPAYGQGKRSLSSSSPSSTPCTQQSNLQSVPAAHHNHSSSKPTPTSSGSRSNHNASAMTPHPPPTSTGYGSHSSGNYTGHGSTFQSYKKSSWSFAPKKKEPRRIPVTMVSNSVNEMTDSLLRSFIQSLNTAEVVYDVATVQPQQVLPEQQCIVGCVSASRLQSDVNATLALFTANKPRALVVLVLHPKAPHVRLHAGAGDKLGAVPGVHAFIDAVFWDARLYACNTNTQANADFQRFFHA